MGMPPYESRGRDRRCSIVYDGKTLTLYGKNLNAYVQTNVSGTIDDVIRAYAFEPGLAAPGSALLFAAPYGILTAAPMSTASSATTWPAERKM
jgi:hypothetical protein